MFVVIIQFEYMQLFSLTKNEIKIKFNVCSCKKKCIIIFKILIKTAVGKMMIVN